MLFAIAPQPQTPYEILAQSIRYSLYLYASAANQPARPRFNCLRRRSFSLVIQHGNLPAAGSTDRFVQRPVQFVEARREVTAGRQGAGAWRALQPPSLNDTCQGISRRSRMSTTR